MSSGPVYVLDATPLIHLAKIEKLNVVLRICQPYITREVHKETVERGEARPDAIVIRDAIERGEAPRTERLKPSQHRRSSLITR